MNQHSILNSEIKTGGNRAITVLIENNPNKVVWYIAPEGMSRHRTMYDLDRCISGYLSFTEDATFYSKAEAIPMAEKLLKCYMISNGDVEFLKDKIESWG